MSSNPERSRLAQVVRLSPEAEAAAAAGRVAEAVALLKGLVRLDPRDRRRLREAAGYYAAKAWLEEGEGFEEWVAEEPEDPMASLMDDIREDVERVVARLDRKGGGR